MSKYWIAVASADHVRRGAAEGFMQVCHGKGGPLKRIKPGDFVAYYSPSNIMGVKDGLQAFTACGRVREGIPYQFDMGDDFIPFRRDVDWIAKGEVKIAPMLQVLSFTAGKRNWGQPFRYGLFQVNEPDYRIIEDAMKADAAS